MFTVSESDQIFSTILLPSEKLLWTGRPNPGEAAKRTIPVLLFGIVWTFMTLIFVGMGVWGILSGKMGFFGIIWLTFTLPFVFVSALLLTTPIWTGMKAKNTYYAITDKRAILIENKKTRSVEAFNLSDLGAPYIIGGRNCPDLYWTVQPVAISSAQLAPGAAASSPPGSSVNSSQLKTTGINTRQSTRFEFSCLPDAQAAFEIANNQNQLLEQQLEKADPLRLDKLKTFSSQGKLYVLSGMDMYEFDGARVTNRKGIIKSAGFFFIPIVLCLLTIFGLNIATSIVNAKNGGIFGLIQAVPFTIFLIITLVSWARGGNFKRVSAAIGAPPVDFSNSKVLARLQQIYAEQGGGKVPQSGFFAKLIGYIVATIVLGGLGAMLLVPIWASYQELQKALNPQQVVEKPGGESISELRDQVKSAEKMLRLTASKQDHEANLSWLANRREWLAAAQIEGGLPADAAEQYAKALPERYEQLEESSSKDGYDKILVDVGRDAIWYADTLRDLKKLKEIDLLQSRLVDEIEKTSKAKHLDPLTEKQVVINGMTLALKDANYDKPQKDTDAKLKQLQQASTKKRDAGYNKLIAVLLDSMK
jgi:hypothetical protein